MRGRLVSGSLLFLLLGPVRSFIRSGRPRQVGRREVELGGLADRKQYVPRVDAGFVRKPRLNGRRGRKEERRRSCRGQGGREAHRPSQIVVAVIQNFADENGHPNAADPTASAAHAHAVDLPGLLALRNDGEPAHANGRHLPTLRGRFFISYIIAGAAAFKLESIFFESLPNRTRACLDDDSGSEAETHPVEAEREHRRARGA